MIFGIVCVIIFGLLAVFQTWRAEIYKRALNTQGQIFRSTFDAQQQIYKGSLDEQWQIYKEALNEQQQLHTKALETIERVRNELKAKAEYSECPACSTSSSVTSSRGEEHFPYGIAPDTVELSALVDTWHCAACSFTFTDWRAEKARERAVQVYRTTCAEKKQPPQETPEIRNSLPTDVER